MNPFGSDREIAAEATAAGRRAVAELPPRLGEVRDFDGSPFIWVELYPPVRQWVELEQWENCGWAAGLLRKAAGGAP